MQTAIAKAAKHLFETEGYGNVSMRSIAKEVGCTPMTLYGYYAAKIDILQTLWSGVFEDLFGTMNTVKAKAKPEDYLVAISKAYLDYWLTHPEHYRLVFMAEGVTQPDVSIFVDQPDIAARFEIFSNALAKASGNGIAPAALKMKFDLLICILHGIAHNFITISGYGWTSPDKLLRSGVNAVLADGK